METENNKAEQTTQNNDNHGGIYSSDWKCLKRFKGKDIFGIDVENYKVDERCTEIGKEAFAHCGNLKKITFSKSLVEIMPYAFCNCHSLECVDGFESVHLIHEYAFTGCTSLSKIRFPDGYVNICEGAFNGCDNLPKEIIEKINEWREQTKLKKDK